MLPRSKWLDGPEIEGIIATHIGVLTAYRTLLALLFATGMAGTCK